MYVEGKYINGTDDLSRLLAIRKEVFGSEEIATTHFFDTDCTMLCDQMAIHALARMENKTVGCGTLFYDGTVFLLGQVGILPEERRKHYGDFIVRMLIDRAFSGGAKEIILYCAQDTVSFFQTIGFSVEKEQADTVRMKLKQGFVCKECAKH